VENNYTEEDRPRPPKNWRIRRLAGFALGDRNAAVQYAAQEAEDDEVYGDMQEGLLEQEYKAEVNGPEGEDLNGSAVKYSQWEASYTGNPVLTSADLPDYSQGA